MAGSVNRVIVIGRLGKDPEVKSFQNGNRVCNFSVATEESWRDKNSGERKSITDWHNIAIFNEGLIGVAEQYLRKGSQVYIEGKMKTRKWQKNGEDRYTTEVVLQGFEGKLVMLGKGSRDSGGGGRQDDGDFGQGDDDGDYGSSPPSNRNQRNSGGYSSGSRGRASPANNMDDDIPYAPEWRG